MIEIIITVCGIALLIVGIYLVFNNYGNLYNKYYYNLQKLLNAEKNIFYEIKKTINNNEKNIKNLKKVKNKVEYLEKLNNNVEKDLISFNITDLLNIINKKINLLENENEELNRIIISFTSNSNSTNNNINNNKHKSKYSFIKDIFKKKENNKIINYKNDNNIETNEISKANKDPFNSFFD